MDSKNPWKMPLKRRGTEKPNTSLTFDPAFKKALQEQADAETVRLGVKISMTTVVMNLSTRNTRFFQEKRAELRRRQSELNKEIKKHARKRKESTSL